MQKVTDIIKKNALALILSGLVVCWTFVKDVFKTGADAKLKNTVVNIVISSNEVNDHFNEIIEVKFNEKLKDPFIWFDVLGSDFVGDFAKEKAIEVHEAIEKKLLIQDSIQQSFADVLGKDLGIRNEDVIPLFSKMLKAFKNGDFETRRVTATY
jgi:hypothetical protein